MKKLVVLAALLAAVLADPASARHRATQDLYETVTFLGAVGGLAQACARDPGGTAEDARAWSDRARSLQELAMRYVKHVAHGDESARMMGEIGFEAAARDQAKNAERMWTDPEGCGGRLRDEIERIIEDLSRFLDAPT